MLQYLYGSNGSPEDDKVYMYENLVDPPRHPGFVYQEPDLMSYAPSDDLSPDAFPPDVIRECF